MPTERSYRAATQQTDRETALAFRLSGHNLSERLLSGSLLAAAAACGVQNSPPGSAALALHARVEDLTPEDVARALAEEKTLLQAWSLRQSPYVFPSRDAAVFTKGLLPDGEEEWRFVLQGFVPVLERIGMSATEAVGLTTEALRDALDGRVLTKREMGTELAKRLPKKLHPWLEPDEFSNFGAVLVRPLPATGLFLIAPRKGNEASFVRTDQWIGEPLTNANPEEACAELVRRYLRCYGPSTPNHFGEWAGVAPSQALRSWRLVESELSQVDLEGRSAWVLEQDLPALEAPPEPRGVRLVPPHDPYLLLRDREILVSGEEPRRVFWRHTGNPGAVLLDGEIIAVWRPRKKGKRLSVSVESFGALSRKARSEIEAEAQTIAPYRGARATEVVFSDVGED